MAKYFARNITRGISALSPYLETNFYL